jgi:acetyl esterase/lipase
MGPSREARAPYADELADVVAAIPPGNLSLDDLHRRRPAFARGFAAVAETVDRLGLRHEERVIERQDDADLVLSVLTPARAVRDAPVLYMLHGGGVVMGDRFFTLGEHGLLDWVDALGIVLVSPEYRLAPESPHPVPVEDCLAGLIWTLEHAPAIGGDAGRVVLGGTSGGGTLAAGGALLARDRDVGPLAGQLLIAPMLDDRLATPSARQHTAADGAGGSCAAETCAFMWDAILGPGHEHADVSPYGAPARAQDLSRLPPTFIDVGGAEVFRDEAVAYASGLWAAGVSTELHVWAGAFHGFDFFAPHTLVAASARAARESWARRVWHIE